MILESCHIRGVYHSYYGNYSLGLDPYYHEHFEQAELVWIVDNDSRVDTDKEVVDIGQKQHMNKENTTHELDNEGGYFPLQHLSHIPSSLKSYLMVSTHSWVRNSTCNFSKFNPILNSSTYGHDICKIG